MTHVREQIRTRAVSVLTGLATTGANVFPSRVHPFHKDGTELPGLAVYTMSEEIENEEGDALSHIQNRSVLLTVEGYVSTQDPEALEKLLDDIAEEVETAIFADQFFTGLAIGTDLMGTESGLSEEAEKPVGVIILIFRVIYLTNEGEPGTAQ